MRERNHKLAAAIIGTMMTILPSQRRLQTTSKTVQPKLLWSELSDPTTWGRNRKPHQGAKECERRREQLARGAIWNYVHGGQYVR